MPNKLIAIYFGPTANLLMIDFKFLQLYEHRIIIRLDADETSIKIFISCDPGMIIKFLRLKKWIFFLAETSHFLTKTVEFFNVFFVSTNKSCFLLSINLRCFY